MQRARLPDGLPPSLGLHPLAGALWHHLAGTPVVLTPMRQAIPSATCLNCSVPKLNSGRRCEPWTTLRERLAKIGARVVRHGRYVVFQLAEVAVPRSLFAVIVRRIDRLRGSPVSAT